jgi:hypothetical protein
MYENKKRTMQLLNDKNPFTFVFKTIMYQVSICETQGNKNESKEY